MRYEHGEATLKAMLQERGLDLGRPDPLATWETVKEFAAVPAEGVDPDDGDLFLFQWGAYDCSDGACERFEIDFTRQFSVLTPSGDYEHMEQLRCTFYYEPTDALKAFDRGERWIEDGFDEV